VIIDEASQCEIPPIIPALYRAKGVTVMGDPDQFPPVINLRESRHIYLRYYKHQLKDMDEKYDFVTGNAYKIVPETPLMLKEHFRCDPQIADYFNRTYYNDKLPDFPRYLTMSLIKGL
jgi:superfamily I DNA and/or RNA helicase